MESTIIKNFLTRQGVAFTFVENFKIEDIDVKKGLANQARASEPLDQDFEDIVDLDGWEPEPNEQQEVRSNLYP